MKNLDNFSATMCTAYSADVDWLWIRDCLLLWMQMQIFGQDQWICTDWNFRICISLMGMCMC